MSNQEHIVSPTWQSVFINLIIDATEKWRQGDYRGSYDSMNALLSWMPQACFDECKGEFEKLEKEYAKVTIRYHANHAEAHRLAKKASDYYLHNHLLKLFALCRGSLEAHGWISKEGGFPGLDPNAESTKF